LSSVVDLPSDADRFIYYKTISTFVHVSSV